VWIVAQNDKPPRTIGELIDRIERIREELMTIQRSMEKLKPVERGAPVRWPNKVGATACPFRHSLNASGRKLKDDGKMRPLGQSRGPQMPSVTLAQ